MTIDRDALVKRHCPTLTSIDYTAPLTVGNGELAFTADVTGFQTLYGDYAAAHMPLCTMAQWGWHTEPVQTWREQTGRSENPPAGKEMMTAYTRADLVKDIYNCKGREVRYPVHPAPGNELVYHWLRENPHRMDLVRIGLVACCGEGAALCREIPAQEIGNIRQTLQMDTGILESHFTWDGIPCTNLTACDPEADVLAFDLTSEALKGSLGLVLEFPYGSPDISGADWTRDGAHETELLSETDHAFTLRHTLDGTVYTLSLTSGQMFSCMQFDPNSFLLQPEELGQTRWQVCVTFHPEAGPGAEVAGSRTLPAQPSAQTILERSRESWQRFWHTTGVIELAQSADPRALELERRIVLSQYLMMVNSAGSLPPAETGLVCNSWYGKFHLEMVFWHEAWLPLYGRTDRLTRCLDWFLQHLDDARALAAENGYRGARLPKMTAADACNAPSPIAPLLVWQQPHLIYMLWLAYQDTEDTALIRRYWPLIQETADFMTDFAVRNKEGFYELPSPLIPVQECHPATETRNPTFEVEYWVDGLRRAVKMAQLIGETPSPAWAEVASAMIPSPMADGRYIARSDCPETYTDYNRDHPSYLMAYGLLDTGRMDADAMERSLEETLRVWDEVSLWGWDFAVMAMTAVRLGRPELAVELLLKDTAKNVYVASGNNRQVSREDLPLYLPGNGSLLLAAAMMAAGYEGCKELFPGFPKDGSWTVAVEGIGKLP
ncbi:MAG: glycoside hydrolase family 65 [Butyrivibrio sp.]|nr:glycoside hydrolase family 65 [Butyrivibrio sp.]